jgi:hypothetical protein
MRPRDRKTRPSSRGPTDCPPSFAAAWPASKRSFVSLRASGTSAAWSTPDSNPDLKPSKSSSGLLAQRRDGGHFRHIGETRRIQAEDLRVFVRVCVSLGLSRTPRVKARVAAEYGPNSSDRRRAPRRCRRGAASSRNWGAASSGISINAARWLRLDWTGTSRDHVVLLLCSTVNPAPNWRSASIWRSIMS